MIELRTMETRKKKKIVTNLLCLFLFSNTVDLKNNNRNYGKTILNILGTRIAATNLFQFGINMP